MIVVIHAAYNDDEKVWYVQTSSLSGVHTDASTLEKLCSLLPDIVRDLIECDGGTITADIPIEVIAHKSTRVVA